ncbi:hypothetical protein K443DRAFT_473547 [Laccaria amethystina LaAM-08-1]|uniref:Uncharacterized protein n=1 Tax=Laccaria amethystina LaAM-08-1 TaxID=1095629 RepID=A0A0C9WVL8_9AGAR|nr:hypothetical protein K443DRAFT_473547 [Laccaria amethystina LaAM-08-1]
MFRGGVGTGLASMPASGFTTLPLARAGETGLRALFFPYQSYRSCHNLFSMEGSSPRSSGEAGWESQVLKHFLRTSRNS